MSKGDTTRLRELREARAREREQANRIKATPRKEADDDIMIKRLAIPMEEKAAKPASRAGKRVLTAHLEPDCLKRLRIMAAEEGVSMEALVTELIEVRWMSRSAATK